MDLLHELKKGFGMRRFNQMAELVSDHMLNKRRTLCRKKPTKLELSRRAAKVEMKLPGIHLQSGTLGRIEVNPQ
jgi:hypothetical protein